MAESIFEILPYSNVLNLAIGVFDGVHLGHQEILRETLKGLSSPTEAAVLTFEPHPLKVIAPDQAPELLSTEHRKVELLQSFGIRNLVVLKFDAALRELSGEQFVEQLHRIFPKLVEVIVGPDWGFGRGREGTVSTMRNLGLRHGFFTRDLKTFTLKGQVVSSTRIREAISRRDFEGANAMLGYSYAVEGVVVHGEQRGRKIGFPTANIGQIKQLIPPRGVYAGYAQVKGQRYPSIMNYGCRPTVSDTGVVLLEAHLINFHGDLYGLPIKVSDFKFIREEISFSSIEELQAQIHQDLHKAKQLLGL